MQHLTKKLAVGVVAVGLPVASALATPALNTLSTTAAITITTPIVIIEQQQMIFGSVQKPATGTGQVEITAAAVPTVTASNGAVVIDSSGAFAGRFNVTALGSTLNLTITDAGGVTGLAFDQFSFDYNAGATTGSGLASGATTIGLVTSPGVKTLYIGGRLQIDSTVVEGAQTPGYDVALDYD